VSGSVSPAVGDTQQGTVHAKALAGFWCGGRKSARFSAMAACLAIDSSRSPAAAVIGAMRILLHSSLPAHVSSFSDLSCNNLCVSHRRVIVFIDGRYESVYGSFYHPSWFGEPAM
jgi:hypothetical protein